MKIVIASDKFKGTLTGAEVAAALATGLARSIQPLEAIAVPVADGGEGTVDAALAAGFNAHEATVSGPSGAPVRAVYAMREHTAVIEMAAASGLDLLPGGTRQPMTASSYGTGELIAHALRAGARTIVLGVGGSATTDAGAGMLQALGVSLKDETGGGLTGGGAALGRLAAIDLAALDPLLGQASIVLAADVDNPLTGPNGAATIFGPQKGASPQQVRELDAALGRFADLLEAQLGTRHRQNPGAGAAGGMGYAAMALLGAQRRRGIEVVLELTGLARALQGADAVITGEGSLDGQSLEGKTPIGVAETAFAHGVPVYAVCGRTTLDEQTLRQAGIRHTVALVDLVEDPAEALTRSAELVTEAGEELGRTIATEHAAHRLVNG